MCVWVFVGVCWCVHAVYLVVCLDLSVPLSVCMGVCGCLLVCACCVHVLSHYILISPFLLPGVPVFCVFELYQFERDRIKILKFHLKSLTPLMGMIWKLAAVVTKASPDQWAIVIGGP